MEEDCLQEPETGDRLDAALRRMAPEFREVLVLKDMEGHKYETIARKLDVPVEVVRLRLQKARQELREILQGEEI